MEGLLFKAVWVYLAANAGAVLVAVIVNHICRYRIHNYYADEHKREMADKIKEQDNRLDNIEEVQQKRSPNYGKIEALERKDEDIDRRINDLAEIVEKEVKDSHKRDEINARKTEEQGKELRAMGETLIVIKTILDTRLPAQKE